MATDGQCRRRPGGIKSYIKKIKAKLNSGGLWRQLFGSDPLPIKTSHLNLGYPYRDETIKYLNNVEGVDDIVAVDAVKETVKKQPRRGRTYECCRQLFEDSPMPTGKSHVELECSRREKITKYLKGAEGVDAIVAIDFVNDTVVVRGNFEEKDVINCFREKMAKEAEVVAEQELTPRGHRCKEEKPRRGRIYGEIEECW